MLTRKSEHLIKEPNVKTASMKQRGVIIAGGGMNFRAWIDEAKAQGYAIVLCGHYCELWS